MNKKVMIVVVGCIVGLLGILFIPKGIDPIENAIVNPINGDIAYTYADYESSVIRLVVYDALGNKLYTKALDSGGGGVNAYMSFSGNTLNVCSGRDRKMYAFDRDGSNATQNIMSKEELTELFSFSGWDKNRNKLIYTLNGNKYVYEKSPFPKYIFNNYCKLYIENGSGDSITLYYDSSN